KGDNAVAMIQLAHHNQKNIRYVGFDLFEDTEQFYRLHPEDRVRYDKIENPYWRFSDQHHFDNVYNKIRAVAKENSFLLIKGDSTLTVPEHYQDIQDAAVLYI